MTRDRAANAGRRILHLVGDHREHLAAMREHRLLAQPRSERDPLRQVGAVDVDPLILAMSRDVASGTAIAAAGVAVAWF